MPCHNALQLDILALFEFLFQHVVLLAERQAVRVDCAAVLGGLCPRLLQQLFVFRHLVAEPLVDEPVSFAERVVCHELSIDRRVVLSGIQHVMKDVVFELHVCQTVVLPIHIKCLPSVRIVCEAVPVGERPVGGVQTPAIARELIQQTVHAITVGIHHPRLVHDVRRKAVTGAIAIGRGTAALRYARNHFAAVKHGREFHCDRFPVSQINLVLSASQRAVRRPDILRRRKPVEGFVRDHIHRVDGAVPFAKVAELCPCLPSWSPRCQLSYHL